MTRSSPNKRKSMAAASPGAATPKKMKAEPVTPKSMKKGPKAENGATPGMAKTPKSMKKGNKMANGGFGNTPKQGPKTPKNEPQSPGKQAMASKTPKSGKKMKKQMNALTPKKEELSTPEVSDDDVSDTIDEEIVPKTPKSAKTPKSNKKGKKANLNESQSSDETSSPKSEKMPMFEGTKSVLTDNFKIPEDLVGKLNKNQKRRLIRKLKKKAKLAEIGGSKPETVMQKTVAEITETQKAKKNKKKNKKNTSILNKSVEITESTNDEVKTEGKKMKKNAKAKGAKTVS